MTTEKFNIQFENIQKKLEEYLDDIEMAVNSSIDYQRKKDILILLSRQLNDQVLDARKIYYNARKMKNEDEFTQSKTLLINCIEVQNKAYNNLITLVETVDPKLAFLYDGVVVSNNDYVARLNKEKIDQNVRYY